MKYVLGENGELALVGHSGGGEGRLFLEDAVCQALSIISGFLKFGLPFFL
jgi:hypothetical protein